MLGSLLDLEEEEPWGCPRSSYSRWRTWTSEKQVLSRRLGEYPASGTDPVITGVGVSSVGRDHVCGPAEKPSRADPQARRDDEPQDTGQDTTVVELPHSGDDRTQNRCQRGIAHLFTTLLRASLTHGFLRTILCKVSGSLLECLAKGSRSFCQARLSARSSLRLPLVSTLRPFKASLLSTSAFCLGGCASRFPTGTNHFENCCRVAWR